MGKLTLKQAAAWCGGWVDPKYEDIEFYGANNDTRLIQPGQLFIVLQGARDGHDFIPAALEKGAAAVLCTHCGNWEILGGFLGYKTLDGEKLTIPETAISVVYKKLTSDVADRFFALNRAAPLEIVGTDCMVESHNILRYAIKHRGEKRMYIYPTDQAPYWGSGRHPIGTFMSQETTAMLGSVGVACKMSHSVVYAKMKHVERGRYEMTFIPICLDASTMSPEDIMRKYYDLLEEEIRETPHNWLWSHNRWKW